jgi:hypothetical protein
MPRWRLTTPVSAGDAVPHRADPTELFDIDVDEKALSTC